MYRLSTSLIPGLSRTEEELQHFSLCSTLKQQLHCGQTKVRRPCYSIIPTALTATRKLLEQPVPSIVQKIRETEADGVIKKKTNQNQKTNGLGQGAALN